MTTHIALAPRERRLAAVLALATGLSWVNGAALSPFLPLIAGDLGTTVPRLGQVTAALFFVAAGISLLIGPLADARGARPLLTIGLLAMIVCSLGTALAPGYWSLLIARLAGALSSGIVAGVALALVAARFDGTTRRRAISWVTTGIAGGVIGGIPLMTLVGGTLGWRAAFALLSVLGIVTLYLLRAILPDDARRVPLNISVIADAYRPLLAHRGMLALYAASALRSASWMGFIIYSGAYFSDRHHLSTQGVGWTFTLGGTAYLAGIILAGRAKGRVPERLVHLIASLVTALCLSTMLAPSPGLPLALAFLSVASVMIGISSVNLASLLAAETPAPHGTTMTLNSSVLELGTAFGGALGGALLAIGGYSALGLGLPIVAALSALLVLRGALPVRRVTAPAT
jgi:MFS transporter, DHA1 family, inner membrane transport protein